MVLPQAVVQQAELQEGGAVVVAQPGGGRQVLDGFLRVPHPDVALCTQLPRFGIPGGDLKRRASVFYFILTKTEYQEWVETMVSR